MPAIRRLPLLIWMALLEAACSSTPGPPPLPEPTPAWRRPEVLDLLTEAAEDPAALVPADVDVFVHLRNGAGILDADDSDPIAREAWSAIEETIPGGMWELAATNLGVDERDLLRELFTRDLCLVDQTIDGRRKLSVLALVESDLLAKLPRAAELEPWAEQPTVGPYRLYRGTSEDHDYLLALGESRLVFSSTKGADHVRRLLVAGSDGTPLLADNEGYRDLMSQLPRKHNGVVFTQSRDGEEAHAVTLIRDAGRYEARYVAHAPDVMKYVEALEPGRGVDFGPQPVDVVAAGTFNLMTKDVPAEGLLDTLLFPYSFRGRVLPRIEPPILLFLGKVPRADIRPDPGFDVPVFGFAIRLTDPEVTADLDRLCSGLHFLASISQLALIEGFFGVEAIDSQLDGEPLAYHRADFGPVLRAGGSDSLLAKLASLPNARSLTRVAFGRIGDFYVICTQEAFFRRWTQAQSGRAARLTAADDFSEFEFQDHAGLIFSALTRGRELSALVNETITFVERARGKDAEEKPEPDHDSRKSSTGNRRPGPRDPDDATRITRPLRWLANGLEQSRTFSVQVWHSDDGLLHGKLVVLR